MTNRLADEKSPYLLQHAHNPVAWYPWGEAAFAKARQDGKPIFLSIGYSTCHWCHVMERESFSDPAVAAILNEHFVSIKVDREERPDVDQLYMQAVMQMTGQGGWPLTVFLTPDLKPFYGGTYFPPDDRWGRPGLKALLQGVADAWKTRRQEMTAAGDSMVQALQATPAASANPEALTEATLQAAVRQFIATYDATSGGFAPAPKFPRSHALSFLLREWKRAHDPQRLAIVERTLQAMAAGGMYDQLGGGFHRYSTDALWRVPHFEKMLYDQALLARTYLEAYQVTKRPEYAAIAREIFDYVLREMTGPEGGFFSAEDADSVIDPAHPHEKGEGAFYVWTAAELAQRLDADAEIFNYLYGVEPGGNAPDDPMGEFHGKNILYRAHTIAEAAATFHRPEPEIEAVVARARRTLLKARGHRPRPHLDDKILTDWNGLMIASFAFGARVLDEPRYRTAAERAAACVVTRLVRHDGRLLHRYRAGDAAILGTLDDHAFFIDGLVELYETTFDPRYLTEARRLTMEMLRLFWDEARGGLFLAGADAERLLVRQKELYDGAVPSGNSMAVLDLLRVGRLTMETTLEDRARTLLQTFAADVARTPSAYPQLLIALDFALGPSAEIVLAGPPDHPAIHTMRRAIAARFLPNVVVTAHPPGETGRAMPLVRGQPAAYVCQNYTCRQPVTDPAALQAILDTL